MNNSRGKLLVQLVMQNNSNCANRENEVIPGAKRSIEKNEDPKIREQNFNQDIVEPEISENHQTVEETGYEKDDFDGYDSDKDPEYDPKSKNGGRIIEEDTEGDEEEYNTNSENEGNIDEDSKSESAEEIPKGRPRKGRKRKYMNIDRTDNRKRRNSNQIHYDYKGKIVKPKEFLNYVCTCKQLCYEKVSEDCRKQEFDKFWELGSYDAQTTYIGARVQETNKKRTYGTGQRKNKDYSRSYWLGKTRVCRDMFVKTLSISTKRVNTSLKKLRSSSCIDKRGKQQGGHNKISDDRKQEVVDQINRIPKYTSHYRRQETESKFLPPEMTLQKMYDTYKTEVEKPVSFQTYRRIFMSEFNLKFKVFKKDTCNTCDSLQAKIISTKEIAEKEKLVKELNIHMEKWQEARQLMKSDMKRAKEEKHVECLTFDLEKTLPLPRIPTNIIFYKRQLWMYNSGIHSGGTNKAYCYVWVEGEAGRGAQEVGSCLLKHIKTYITDETKELILWADSCGGQNRNIKMVLLLKVLLESKPGLEKIRLRFLVSGHSFLPNDSDFSDIESALKHQQRLYIPEDYIRVMQDCRRKNRFIITRMRSGDFVGTSSLEKKITNRKVDINKMKISWLATRELMLLKSKPFSMYLRSDFNSEFSEIDITKRQAGRPLTSPLFTQESLIPLWPNGKKIPLPKLQDLRSIIHLIPDDAKNFYESLEGDGSIEDDVDGFSGTPDFDVESEEQ